MALIINADDFGKDHKTNMAICEAFAKGLINRTTLMANMESASEAMELARQNGFIDKVGVHLNLTQGKPLTENMARNREMCDENGMFTADFHRNTLKRFVLGAATRKDIREELDAQLSRFFELGGVLRHIDSHHHVHTDVSVYRSFKKLISKYNICSIRLGRNLYKGGNSLMRLYKVLLNKSFNKFNTARKDYFGSVEDFENYGADSQFVKDFDIEIMVHPMYVDDVLFDTDYPMSNMKNRLGGAI